MRLVGVVLLFSSLAFAQRGVFHAQNVTVVAPGGSITAYCAADTTAAGGRSDPYSFAGLSGHATSSNDLVVVGFGNASNINAIAVTDNLSQSYTVDCQTHTGQGETCVAYKYASASGVTTITISGQGFSTNSMAVCKATGIKYATDPLDPNLTAKGDSGFTSSTSWTTGNTSGNASQASEFLFGAVTNTQGGSNTWGLNATYTAIGGDSSKVTYFGYAILTSASGAYAFNGTFTPTFSGYYFSVLKGFEGQ